MIENERQLIGLALRLIGKTNVLSKKEQRLVAHKLLVTDDLEATTRQAITAGDDPLGTWFCLLRSPEIRRDSGATYTPAAIVTAMVSWAAKQGNNPIRIVDPGAGSGRFLMAAAKAFPTSDLVAVETDPLALLLLRANAEVSGFAHRLTVKAMDYRRIRLPKVDGPTLFLGNPPYVRHHNINERWKSWFAETATKYGFKASKLAGLHIHFFLKTRTLGKKGDFGAFITAAEWMDVNYGAVLRQMLGDGLGGASLHVIDPEAKPFADAQTTGAITCFQVGNRPDAFQFNAIKTLNDLGDLTKGKSVAWQELSEAPRWSVHIRKSPKRSPGDIELGELFRVHRGQVTGANSVWIAGPLAKMLPKRFLIPTVTKARDLIQAGDYLTDAKSLRCVIDLPVDLSELTKKQRQSVDTYLDWARTLGTPEGFVAKNRKAWWSVNLRDPAPILCTYMARRAPVFVRNLCDARHLNIAHGLYPREPMSDETLARVLQFLKHNVSISDGRIYAGGLAKFEPREVERLTIPSFDRLEEMAAE